MRWSPQQAEALDAVERWRRDRSQPWFFLGGYAGTGKTTLARHLAEGCDALFAAYTGKAASVMRQMGCTGASTIHSLIYQPQDKSRRHLRELEARLVSLKNCVAGSAIDLPELDEETKQLEAEIRAERENLRRPSFTLNLESALRGADLLVVDEGSMPDKQTGEDLVSFGVPILVLGDPAQLPPVFGAGYFTARPPDRMLTEVHRQALDSPVLRLATMVREGCLTLPLGEHGTSRVTERVEPEEVLAVDQVLVGHNKTRRASIRRIRELRGLSVRSPYPLKGERVVCLRNNHDLGIMNGGVYVAAQDAVGGPDWVNLRIVPEEGGPEVLVGAHPEHFLGRGDEIDQWDRRDAEEFDFAGALTVHKAQGSQFRSGVLFDEWRGDYRKEHLYTGLTRFSDRVTVVRTRS